MISHFPTPTPLNIGGIVNFEFAPVHLLDALPVPVNGIITTAIEPATGDPLFKGFASIGTAKLKENHKRTEQGVSYISEIPCFVPGDSDALLLLFSEMELHRFVVITTDASGKRRVCGNIQNGMRFETDYDSGNIPGDARGYTVKFIGENNNRWPFYQPVAQGGNGA